MPVRGPSTATQVTEALRLGRTGRLTTHRLLLVALVLVLMIHGGLLLAGSYQRTYDAYVHIFFADHYRRWWWSSWEPRWYTGFSTVSYPPGSHQTVAALSTVVGLRAAFVAVQVGALLTCTVGVYRWAMIWTGQHAAGWAAIAFALSSSTAETVHVFGQLPTTFSLGFLLNSLPFAYRWVVSGSGRALLAGVTTAAATTAGHHVTTLFGSVFFLGPVLVIALVDRLRTPLDGEPDGSLTAVTRATWWPVTARRLRRIAAPALRAGAYGGLVGCFLLIVVLPYWLWSSSDPIVQVSIPHASRDNFLVNLPAGLVFWLVPWGTTLIALPYAVARGLASRAWPLTLSLCLLTFLGTGGTTPYPRLLLGGAFDILTLDRFTFWATISVLPLVGLFLESMTSGTLRAILLQNLGRRVSAALGITLAVAHLGFTLFSINLTHYRPFQPAGIEIKPILSFLDKDSHSQWRYLALGFGDQMAWLGANTLAVTVDGNYHSARRLPELTSRPIERLEGAKYSGVPGIGSLQQFLSVPERYSLKYAFVNDHFYDPLLHFSGWVDLGPLENGISVWERADVPPLADVTNRQVPLWQRLMWGTLPPGALSAAAVLLLWSAAGQPLPRRVLAGAGLIGRLAAATPPGRAAAAADRWLERSAASLAGAPVDRRSDRWHPVRPLVAAVRRRSRVMIAVRRRRIQGGAVVVLAAAGLAAGGASLAVRASPTPEDTVFGYYDDLDFRRFPEAYARLDPTTRPDYDQYRADIGRDGGLVASFAKLDEIRTRTVERAAGRVVVETATVYLTALDRYTSVDRVELRRRGDRWYLELPQADPAEPPDQFTSREAVRYISQGRRRVTSGTTRATDVLDRPQVALSGVRSLRAGPRWLVVGEVTNIDTVPADVTVSAHLRDADRTLLSSWNAAQVINHQLLPGETTPFRLEFQSIAGVSVSGTEAKTGTLHVREENPVSAREVVKTVPVPVGPAVPHNGPVEFDPTSITPLALPGGSRVAAVEVYARAVVTTRNLTRGLHVVDLHLVKGSDGKDLLTGTLRNDSPGEIAVPHLLVTYRDPDGALAWVDHAYLAHSIGSQRSARFGVPLSTSAGLAPSGVPTSSYTGASRPGPAALLPPMVGLPPMAGLPPGGGFASVSVVAGGYIRGSTS
ncbi:MAG: hypothetical protein QG622_913 [Actinomycetota bacterium]|nr:hypothetical protein [Actinomycetota bacterium]